MKSYDDSFKVDRANGIALLVACGLLVLITLYCLTYGTVS